MWQCAPAASEKWCLTRRVAGKEIPSALYFHGDNGFVFGFLIAMILL
jgi:hypothetical protein